MDGRALRRAILLVALLCLMWFGTETATADQQVESGGKTGIVGVGVPYSSVIDDPGAPYNNLFTEYNTRIDPSLKFGPSRLRLDLGSATLNPLRTQVPWLRRGAPPEEAKLKIGNLYLNVDRVTGQALWTDNAKQQENNRKSGAISVVKAPVEGIFQLNDGLRLETNADLIWLPTAGKAGVSGFMKEPFELRPEAYWDPQFRVALRVPFEMGGWEMEFRDTFEIIDWAGRAEARARLYRQLDLINEQKFDEVDQIGRYSYGPYGTTSSVPDRTDSTLQDRFAKGDMYYLNRAELNARRLLPTMAECNVSVFRDDYLYAKERGNRDRWRHGMNVSLVSLRENLRLKPYVTFSTDQYDRDEGWNKTARVGARGPLSDYLTFDGNIGYHEPSTQKYHDWLYFLSIAHTPGPLTRQQLTWDRNISEPGRELNDALRYQLLRILGPDLTGSFLAEWRHYEDRNGTQTERDEYSSGLRLDYTVLPKLEYRFTGLYTISTTSNDRNTAFANDEWDLIFDILYHWSPTFLLQLTYEYDDYSTKVPSGSHYENLVILKATKKF